MASNAIYMYILSKIKGEYGSVSHSRWQVQIYLTTAIVKPLKYTEI